MEGLEKTRPTGGENGKPLQYTSLENSMNCIKRQKDVTLKDELLRLEDVQYAIGKSGVQLLIAPERMKRLGQSGNDAQLWMCLVVKVKSKAIKNNISYEPGMSDQGTLDMVKQEMIRVNIDILGIHELK